MSWVHETVKTDPDKPDCEHDWYLMPYAISDNCYHCTKCKAERWVLLIKDGML